MRFNLACLAWRTGRLQDAYALWSEGVEEGAALHKTDHEFGACCKLAILPMSPPDGLAGRICRLLEIVDRPRNKLLAAVAQFCLVAREARDVESLTLALDRVRAAAELLPGTPDVEDSAAPAFWAAARALERLGEIDLAQDIAAEALEIADGRIWPHAEELNAFRDRAPG